MEPFFFLSDAATVPFWIGWEAMIPITKITIVVGSFLLGLLLAYLYRGRWARRHLRLLREQDQLKRQWDVLTSNPQPVASDDIAAQTSGNVASPAESDTPTTSSVASVPEGSASLEPMPTVAMTASAATPPATKDSPVDPALTIIEEPISLALDSSAPEETKMSANDLEPPLADTPIPEIDNPETGNAPTELIPLIEPVPVDLDQTEPLSDTAGMTDRVETTTVTALATISHSEETSDAPPTPIVAKTEAIPVNIPSAPAASAFPADQKSSNPPEVGSKAAVGEDRDSSPLAAPAIVLAAVEPAPDVGPCSNHTESDKQSTPLIVKIPADADPLHLLTGLNAAAANALINRGITRFDQVLSMDDNELAQLANTHSSLEPLRWREVRDEVRIDARMRSNPAVPPTAATRENEKPATASTTESRLPERSAHLQVEISPEESQSYEKSDALTALDGIDSVAAKQLNEAGIRSYKGVANLEPADFDELARRFMGLRKFSWPFWQDKLKAQASYLAGLGIDKSAETSPVQQQIEHAKELISETKDKIENVTREGKCVVSSGVSQIKSALEEAKKLTSDATKESGSLAAKAAHAVSGTTAQITDLLHAEFEGEDVVADLQLGILYKKAPARPDDLTAIDGVGSDAAKALNSAGIYTYRQVAHLGDTAPPVLEGRSQALAGIDWSAATASAATLKGHPVKEAVTKAAESMKEGAAKAATEAKASVSHLAETVTDSKKRSAVIEKGREEIKEATDRVKEVAGKAGTSAREAMEELQAYAQHFTEEWKAEQSAAAAPKSIEPTESDETTSPHVAKQKLSLATKARHLDDFIEARIYGDEAETDEDAGFRYKTAPLDADDLTKLPGLEPRHAGCLNALGIYKLRQISKWTDTNIHTITHDEPRLHEHDLRLWRAEARVEAPRSGFRNAWNRISDTARSTVRFYLKDIPPGFEGDEVEMSSYGVVYTVQPSNADPLERLTGISTEIASRLNRMGVYRFKQIASWSIRVRQNIAERLELPATARIDNWVEQAKKLAD